MPSYSSSSVRPEVVSSTGLSDSPAFFTTRGLRFAAQEENAIDAFRGFIPERAKVGEIDGRRRAAGLDNRRGIAWGPEGAAARPCGGNLVAAINANAW